MKRSRFSEEQIIAILKEHEAGVRFNGRLRDELLNETLFSSLTHARAVLALWRADYNGSRPHSQLDWQTPAEFASTFNPCRALTLRNMKSFEAVPASSPARQGKTNAGNELRAG